MWTPFILILLIAASAGYFLYTVSQRLQFSKSSRRPLPWDRAGARFWRVLREVVLQTRVIRERPVAGVLHALVMWGFAVFAWATFEHFVQGFHGLETVRPDTTPDPTWYGAFAAVWAVAVLVGISGLSFRRFVLRPKALGKPSPSSAVVALLIVILMLTYLAGWAWLEPGSPSWRANWWTHVFSVLAMLWVIPKSKHLHLLLGPVAIFFRSETTSGMRPLREDDDDDLGLLCFGELSPKDLLDVSACVECGRCSDVCPANRVGQTLDPKQIILRLQHGLLAGAEGIAGTAAQVQKGDYWVSEDDLFQCLSCGACEEACPVGIEHVGAKILDMRRGLVSEGRTHNDKLSSLFTTMERSPHNPWGVSHETRRKLIETEEFPVFDGSQEWLFWLGCGVSYDPHGQDVARAMRKILDAAGVSWGVLARETCCGEPARRAGNEYLYMELSEKVIDSFRSAKVKNLVTCCPHCTRMLDVDYRQNKSYEELGVRVVHHTELLAELAPSLHLNPQTETVTFHDPCYLARGRGVTEQPRAALAATGAQLVETENNRSRTFCCGAGGAQLFIADDKSDPPGGRINHQRFAQLAATGASKVAVACPYCPIMLKDAASQAGRDDIVVADVAEILADRL
ncbi:MAG: (Fe-S)-binding protein [Acidobacteria bacterium]|nr:(Fe-S)-binding protein [Acidobacteriota bacterium]